MVLNIIFIFIINPVKLEHLKYIIILIYELN